MPKISSLPLAQKHQFEADTALRYAIMSIREARNALPESKDNFARCLSIALTHTETALLWLIEASGHVMESAADNVTRKAMKNENFKP